MTFILAIHRATRPKATPSDRRIWLLAALASGVLAGTVKVTTFVPWWTGAAILALARARRTSPERATIVSTATALAIPILMATGWLAFLAQ